MDKNPIEPSPGPDLALRNAQDLTQRYIKMKERVRLRRTLEECLAKEREKIDQLYVAYLPYLDMNNLKFLRGQYFLENDRFIRYQEMPERFLMSAPRNYYFISHRWLGLQHPDPDGAQFDQVREYVLNLEEEVIQTWGFWYDYCCIPQRDVSGRRSPDEERQFQAALKVMHLLPMLSSNITIFDMRYLDRAWCFMELTCATKISPVLATDTPLAVPFFNFVKFRHLALLVLFLMKDDEFRRDFMKGNDQVDALTTAHLNRLISKTLSSCTSTIKNDKSLIVSMLYEHFWHHLRFVGLRTQTMTAWRLLERCDEAMIEAIFAQFLIISEDPTMAWTTETTFVMESVLPGLGNPSEMVFHRHEITKGPRSSS